MRSRASWRLTRGQRPRQCEVSRYRHGCDPPQQGESLRDYYPVLLPHCSSSNPTHDLTLVTILSAVILRDHKRATNPKNQNELLLTGGGLNDPLTRHTLGRLRNAFSAPNKK